MASSKPGSKKSFPATYDELFSAAVQGIPFSFDDELDCLDQHYFVGIFSA
jgi:hypothetical protein